MVSRIILHDGCLIVGAIVVLLKHYVKEIPRTKVRRCRLAIDDKFWEDADCVRCNYLLVRFVTVSVGALKFTNDLLPDTRDIFKSSWGSGR